MASGLGLLSQQDLTLANLIETRKKRFLSSEEINFTLETVLFIESKEAYINQAIDFNELDDFRYLLKIGDLISENQTLNLLFASTSSPN